MNSWLIEETQNTKTFRVVDQIFPKFFASLVRINYLMTRSVASLSAIIENCLCERQNDILQACKRWQKMDCKSRRNWVMTAVYRSYGTHRVMTADLEDDGHILREVKCKAPACCTMSMHIEEPEVVEIIPKPPTI